jgi:hypothetical protein
VIVPNDPQGPPQAAEVATLALNISEVWSCATEMLSVTAAPPGSALNEVGLTVTTAGVVFVGLLV